MHIADDKNLLYVSTISPGMNDYINAVFVDVNVILINNILIHYIADDENRPYLSTKSSGTNDYINAVFADVNVILINNILIHYITDDENRPYLSTKSPGTNDYINAVFVDVSVILTLHGLHNVALTLRRKDEKDYTTLNINFVMLLSQRFASKRLITKR